MAPLKASLISVVTVLSAGLSVTELLQHWEEDSIVACKSCGIIREVLNYSLQTDLYSCE